MRRWTLTAAQRQQLNQEIVGQSLPAAHVLSVMIALFELMMIIRSQFCADSLAFKRPIYLWLYLLLFLLALVAVLLFEYAKYTEKTMRWIMPVFAGILLFWSAGIAVLDLSRGDSSIVFVITIFGVAGVVFLYPLESWLLFLGACLFLCLSLYFYHRNTLQLVFYLNVTVVLAIALSISVIKYRTQINEFFYKKQLAEKNQRLHVLVDELKRMSAMDELTGLKNRLTMDQVFSDMMHALQQKERPFSVAMLDLDDFKAVNDTYGHTVGDHCLKGVAEILKNVLSAEYLFRFGGEEFLALMDLNAAEAGAVMEQARDQIEKMRIGAVRLSVSIGLVTRIPRAGETVKDYIDRADQALYRSKTNGKNCVTAG